MPGFILHVGRSKTHGITDVCGICGPYHYYLNLTQEEASFTVAHHHDILLVLEGGVEELTRYYSEANTQGKCLCTACTGVGHSYSVLPS